MSEGEGVILLILAYWTVTLAVGLLSARRAGRRAFAHSFQEAAAGSAPAAPAELAVPITADPSCLAAYALVPPVAVVLAWLLL